MQRTIPWILGLLGAAAALLAARLVLRLFAARPDNPAFAALFALTAPLAAPFAALDTGQPHFGATLEFSTVAALLILIVLIAILRGLRHREQAVNRSFRD